MAPGQQLMWRSTETRRANRALARWILGYPEIALADADDALEHARESGHAGTLMYAQLHTSFTNILCTKYAAANAQSNSCPVGGREGRSIMEGPGNDAERLRISAVRQGLRGNPDDHLG